MISILIPDSGVNKGGSRILRKEGGAKFFYKFISTMWRFSERIFVTVFSGVFNLNFFYWPFLFFDICSDNHQSSWQSTCSILAFCYQAKKKKYHMTTNQKERLASDAPRLNLLLINSNGFVFLFLLQTFSNSY